MKDTTQTDWQEELRRWFEKQEGTAGFEQKLENYIETNFIPRSSVQAAIGELVMVHLLGKKAGQRVDNEYNQALDDLRQQLGIEE